MATMSYAQFEIAAQELQGSINKLKSKVEAGNGLRNIDELAKVQYLKNLCEEFLEVMDDASDSLFVEMEVRI